MSQILPEELKNYMTCCPNGTAEYVSLQTFLNTDTPSYPVGVFNINGLYLGIADNESEYVTLWNSDIDNQTEGILEVTSNPFRFKITSGSSLGSVIGLRYWQIELESASASLYLSDDTYVELASGSVVKSEASPLGLISEFGMSTITTTTPLSTVIVTDTFRKVPVTTGIIRVFHNEVGSYASMSISHIWKNNYGNLPPTLKCISFYRIAQDLDVYNISPLNYLNYYEATQNIELFQVNCSRMTWTSNYIAHMNKLKAFQFLNNGTIIENRYFSMFGLNATKHPNLKQIIIRYNIKTSLGIVSISDFANLPPLLWGLDLAGARVETSTDIDNILIGLASSIPLAPILSGTRISLLQQAVLRTSASNTALSHLQTLGYNVLVS